MSSCPPDPVLFIRALVSMVAGPIGAGSPGTLLPAPADTKTYSLPFASKAAFRAPMLTVIALGRGLVSFNILSWAVKMTVWAAPTVTSHWRRAWAGMALRPKSTATAVATTTYFLKLFFVVLIDKTLLLCSKNLG